MPNILFFNSFELASLFRSRKFMMTDLVHVPLEKRSFVTTFVDHCIFITLTEVTWYW